MLITGANGFVGQLLCAAMLKQGWRIRAALRLPHQMPAGVKPVIIGEIDGKTGSAIPFSDEKKINFGKSENAPVDFHNWAGIGNKQCHKHRGE